MKKILYCYKGKYYGILELCQMSGKSASLIYSRLKRGWGVEEAVDTPIEETSEVVAEYWRGKVLRIMFHESVKGVVPHMQPSLETIYTALPGVNQTRKRGGSKEYYIIKLACGSPLIVYPGEFEILGEAAEGDVVYEKGEESRQAEPGSEES